MKKYKILVALILLILGTVCAGNNIFAQTSTGSAVKLQKLAQREQTIKDKTILEINRRLTSLTNLTTRVNDMKKISDQSKNTLVLQIQDQITSLNNLKIKIQSDNDAVTLKDDRLGVTAQYRIYLLFIPKMHILATADRLMEITGDMDQLIVKIQIRIDSAKQNGKDITVMQTALDNIKSKIADANIQAKAATDLVTPLVPDQGDQVKAVANKLVLQDARKKLVAARQDLNLARQSFDLIKQELNPVAKINTSSSSAIKQ